MTQTDTYGNYLRYGAKTRPKVRGVQEIDITKGLITGFRGRESSVPDGYCTRLLNVVPRNDGSYAARPPFLTAPAFNGNADEDGSVFASVAVGTFSDGGVLSINDAFAGFNVLRVIRTGFTTQTLATSDRRHYGNAAHYGNVSVVPYILYVGGDRTNAKVGALVVTFNPTLLTMTVTASDLTATFGHAAYVYRDHPVLEEFSAYGRSFALSWKGRTFILAGSALTYSAPLQPGVFTAAAGGGFIPLDTTSPITGAFVLQDVMYIATESELFAMTYNTDPGRDRNIRTHTKVAIFGAAEYDNIGYFACSQGLYRIVAGQLVATFIPSDQNYANARLTGDTGSQIYPLGQDSVDIPRVASVSKIGDSILIAGLSFNPDKRFGQPVGAEFVYPVFNTSTETWTEWKRDVGADSGLYCPVNALPLFNGNLNPVYGFPVSHIMQIWSEKLSEMSTTSPNARQMYMNAQPTNDFHFSWANHVNTNPTFEVDLSDWTAGAGLTWTRDGAQNRKGAWSGKFVHANVGLNCQLKTGLRPAAPGEPWKFDCWIYNTGAVESAVVGIRSVDGIGVETQEANSIVSCAQNVWTYCSADVVIDDPDTVNVLGIVSILSPENTDTFHIDEAYLRPASIISPYCDVLLDNEQTGHYAASGFSEVEYFSVDLISAYEILLQTGRMNFGSPLTWKRLHRAWMEVSLPGERLRSYNNPIWWNFYHPHVPDEDGEAGFREIKHKRIGTWHPLSDTFHNQTPGFHQTQDEEDVVPIWNYDYLLFTYQPIVWWKFDETAGTVADNFAGVGFDGTIGSTMVLNQTGLVNQGTSFKTGSVAGADTSSVRLVSSPLDGTDRFTLGFWCKFDTAAYSDGYLASLGTADFSWGQIFVNGTFPNLDIYAVFDMAGVGGVPELVAELSSAELGSTPGPVFIAFTYNAGEHSLYINGELWTSGLQIDQSNTDIFDCRQLLINGWTQDEITANIQNTCQNTFFDETFLCGRNLTPDEIMNLYKAASSAELSPVTEVNYSARFTSASTEFSWRYPIEEANHLDLTNLPRFDEVGIGRLFADISEYKASNAGI